MTCPDCSCGVTPAAALQRAHDLERHCKTLEDALLNALSDPFDLSFERGEAISLARDIENKRRDGVRLPWDRPQTKETK